jgi:phosphoribosylaminoimidazole-succinocarboxamide synthase|tara:strand:- start:1490 stop:2437 length:948 start_codon:yes stop_codon:yes gene_type:complete
LLEGNEQETADMSEALLETDLDLPNKRQGKVRDLYDVTLDGGTEALLIVATDRISAFDVVLGNGLPGKGVVLTQISRFWFDYFESVVEHHLISTDPADVPGLTETERANLAGRMMLCRKTQVVPIECIARGYITGSGWKDYQRSGAVCGIELPAGLVNSDRLEAPLFTPSTKAESGHDENISFEQGAKIVGRETMEWLRDTTLMLYVRARDYALERGIILADTKFEFGRTPEGTVILIDEIFTPDSSRFWPAEEWQPGREQPSFDKQIVRNYLETVVDAGEWDKNPPGPLLPPAVVERSIARYREAFRLLTGKEL